MSGQSTRLARPIGWFRDVKTLPKLLLGFDGIGWTGMQSLRAMLDAMLIGSTVIFAKVGTLIINAGF